MKHCKSKLHEGETLLSLDNFPHDKSRKDGHTDHCKVCTRKRRTSWYHRVYSEDPNVQSLDDFRAGHRRRSNNRKQRKGFKYTLLCSVRGRAKRRGLTFNLKEEDISLPLKCPILGIDIIQNWQPDKKHTKEPNYPTIDRIDSNKGYTKDNIQIISWRANCLKHNATLEEMIMLGKWAKNKLKN